jgi:hypothetical protein
MKNGKYAFYVNLLFVILGAFMLGAYASSMLHCDKEIESYRWGLTSFFELFFIIALFKSRNNEQ